MGIRFVVLVLLFIPLSVGALQQDTFYFSPVGNISFELEIQDIVYAPPGSSFLFQQNQTWYQFVSVNQDQTISFLPDFFEFEKNVDQEKLLRLQEDPTFLLINSGEVFLIKKVILYPKKNLPVIANLTKSSPERLRFEDAKLKYVILSFIGVIFFCRFVVFRKREKTSCDKMPKTI